MKSLSRARFENFRCFEEMPPLELEDVNIFAGPNNSGKSALLNAIRRLVSVNPDRYVADAAPYWKEGGHP